MKKNKNMSAELLKKLKTLVVILIGIAVLSSCLKTYVDPRIDTSAHTVFVNAVADQSSYTFYLDNFRVNNQSIPFLYALPYLYVTSGSKKIDLIPRNGSQAVASDTILFKAQNYYTVFAVGTTTPEFVVLEDALTNLTNPSTGKAKVRLINLSSGAPNIDLLFHNGTTLFTGLAYKVNTDFISIDPGIYDLDFRQTGSTTIKLTKHVVIEPGRLYTIFALGVWDPVPAEPGLDLGLIDAR